MQLDIYYSYACRESYLVFDWLNTVNQSGQTLDIHWRPFAIQMDGINAYWQQPWITANSELRGFIAAEAARRQGNAAFLRFHAALEQAVHEQFLELGDETTLIVAAHHAALNLDQFQADLHDRQLAQAAQNSHTQAFERWHVSGTPTLVFPDGRSLHLELSEIPAAAHALETFRAVETLTSRLSYSRQLRLSN